MHPASSCIRATRGRSSFPSCPVRNALVTFIAVATRHDHSSIFYAVIKRIFVSCLAWPSAVYDQVRLPSRMLPQGTSLLMTCRFYGG